MTLEATHTTLMYAVLAVEFQLSQGAGDFGAFYGRGRQSGRQKGDWDDPEDFDRSYI